MAARSHIRRLRLAPLGLAAAVIAVLVVILTSGGGSYTLWASFDRVNGLVSDANVQAGGVDVGKVQDIKLGADGYPRVKMSIDDSFHVNRTGTASVRFFSVGGEANRVIELTDGTGARMSSGSTIPRSRTDVPQEIDQVLSLLDPRTRGDIHQLFHNLRTATDGRSADIASSLRYSSRAFSETSTVLNELDTDSVALRQVVSAGDTTLSALARDPQALGGAVDQLAALLQATGRQQTALSDAIASAPAGLGAATTAFARLDRSVPPLTGLVTDARPAFRELAHEAPNVQATLTAARPALAQAKGLVAQRSDVSQLGHLLDVALPTLQDLRPTLDAALPAIGEVRARFPDAFGFLANWDDFHSSYDAVGHAGRVGLIFAPTPTTSIGPNDVGSGELRPPFVRNPGTLAGVPWSNYASTVPKAKK